MNKKIFFLMFCCLIAVPSAVIRSEYMNAIVMQGQEDHEVQQVDLEDFFNADAQEPRTVNRIKKKPLTKAQIVLMQVGISVAMGCESAYKWVKSFLLWISSYVCCLQEESHSNEA